LERKNAYERRRFLRRLRNHSRRALAAAFLGTDAGRIFRADEKPAKVHRPARRRAAGKAIVTEMLNHDFLAAHTEIRAADTPPIKVCNVGGGNTGIAAYRITSYAHLVSDVGRHKKKLLHKHEEKKVPGT
jgi:hypothetical protein